MSYSKPYTINVPYSGSISVNYPKSENGGSKNVSYSGTTSAEIVIHVDTAPFDHSVARVNNHVDGLTGAVIAMNAAQVAAINNTAQAVSSSILNGFFGTIKAEISQQLQALDSAVKATFGLIQEQGKAVTQKKDQMESDFNRIKSRYVDLFTNLDIECRKRISELDKPAFYLSEIIQKKLINETASGEGAKNFVAINEEASSKMMLLTSSILKRAREVIKTIDDYITQEIRLTALIDSFVEPKQINKKTALLIPVIFIESDTLEDNNAGLSCDCFLPGIVSDKDRPAITEQINTFCRNETVSRWDKPDETSQDVLDKEFRLLAETEFADNADDAGEAAHKRRIYDKLVELWENRDFLALSK
jgi:hypothetical protein